MTQKANSTTFQPDDPVTNIPLVGPRYAERLEKLGIFHIKDLIFHFPARFQDTRNVLTVSDLIREGKGTIVAQVEKISNTRTRTGKFLTTAFLRDETGKISTIWFNQPYLTKTIKVGEKYFFNGKIDTRWGVKLVNPQYEKASEETTHLAKLSPVYPETYGVSSKWLRARLRMIKELIPTMVKDYIQDDVLKKEKLIGLSDAIIKIHFPESEKDIEQAEERLGMDELVEIQKQALEFAKKKNKNKARKIDKAAGKNALKQMLANLGYELTNAQKRSLEEVLDDFGQDKPMHRLLNGDVGSGKTVVALGAAVVTHANGFTTIIMAPTTILANQHYQNIKSILSNSKLDIPVKLLTSSQKDNITEEPQIIIGTHALLFNHEIPANTAFIVIDEQHRFGVEQREELTERLVSQTKLSPHYLTMSATPIPRTLTLALYGQTNVSILDEMPAGRIPVKTYLVPQEKRKDSYKWISEHVEKGEQAFVICPLVNESEKVEAKAATEEFEKLKEVFPKLKLGLVHGQLKSKEKDKLLADFKDRKIDMLVATPVVEVGIDIPNAAIMIIENSERFGLAQLHQFRGRIGRGGQQAYCFLFTDSNSEEAIERLHFFSKNTSGFKVAEFDLKRRGPGEVYGLKQSGILKLRFADISDAKEIARAQRIAAPLTSSGKL